MSQPNDSRGSDRRKEEIDNREFERARRARHWAVTKRQHLTDRLMENGIEELEARGYKVVG